MKLLERKFYRKSDDVSLPDIEVSELQDADYMIVKQLMTKAEVEKEYPLKKT